MKKLLKLLIIVPVIFLAVAVFASSSFVTTKNELVSYLKSEIEKGTSQISVVYKTDQKLENGFGMNVFKEAIEDLDYQRNNYSRVEFKTSTNNGDLVLTWIITYRTTEIEETAINNYVRQEALKIKSKTSNKAEQVRLVNKLVRDKITYSDTGISYATAYGAITDGRVVCHGYTLLTERLLTELGIDNKIVIGYDKKNTKHSWNLVSIDGTWFHVDVTYNDTAKLADAYLLKSDNYMSLTRSWDYYSYPQAISDYTKPVLYVSLDTNVKTDAIQGDVVEQEETTEVKVETNTETKTETKIETKTETTPSKWVETYLEKASNYGIVPNYILESNNSLVTREQFVEIIMSIYSKFGTDVYTSKTFSDTNNINVLKAYELGITSGVSADVFAPNKTITREQAAVMIFRLLEIFNKTYAVENNSIIDINQVSSWALTQVKFVNYVGIMNGASKNYINPQGYLQKNEAISLAVSTYEYIK